MTAPQRWRKLCLWVGVAVAVECRAWNRMGWVRRVMDEWSAVQCSGDRCPSAMQKTRNNLQGPMCYSYSYPAPPPHASRVLCCRRAVLCRLLGVVRAHPQSI
ncbi:uncharacterized protein J3D65DRAFT_630982 [Phyllosticta citribraziliensis]|uniref:Secreted protein n=1 Tax=Phyllosticta citribraziliensis TaxID=989973 RepID=A0ABR1LJG2_9PEZI